MRRRLSITLVAGVLLALPSAALAQGHGGDMGGPGGHGPGMGAPGGIVGGRGLRNGLGDGRANALGDTEGRLRIVRPMELQLAPTGRWWDDDRFTRLLRIDAIQRRHMDDVFSASRPTLMDLYKKLEREEMQLAKVVRSKNPDEGDVFQQIDRVTQARGELEKANAHMQLELRKTMSPGQVSKLDDLRFNQAETSPTPAP